MLSLSAALTAVQIFIGLFNEVAMVNINIAALNRWEIWLGLFIVSLFGLRLLVTERGEKLRKRLAAWPPKPSLLHWPVVRPVPGRFRQ